MTLLIVDPWQSCVCFIRSGVTQCTLLMVLYLDHMCQRGLHAVLWSHIGYTLMHSLAAEPCSTPSLLFPSRCPSGAILLTPYSMVWAYRVSRAGPMLFYWPKLFYPYVTDYHCWWVQLIAWLTSSSLFKVSFFIHTKLGRCFS